MKQPKDFGEVEKLLLENDYAKELYPFTSELLTRGREEKTAEYCHHRAHVKKLWEQYKRMPTIECTIGFKHYFTKTAMAIDDFVQSNHQMIKEVVSETTYDHLKQMSKEEYRLSITNRHITASFEDDEAQKLFDALGKRAKNDDEYWFDGVLEESKKVIGEEKTERMRLAIEYEVSKAPTAGKQPFYDVTDMLGKSMSKGGCKMFVDAYNEGKRVYAFVAPKLHKWKTDENGLILKDKDDNTGEFMMDVKKNELIFYSVLCAHYTDPLIRENMDLRFVADTEVLDVKEHYEKKSKELKENGDPENKRESCNKRLHSRKSMCYGIYLNEIEEIRKKLSPGENEAVFLITANAKGKNSAYKTINSFVYLHNGLKNAAKWHTSLAIETLFPGFIADKYRNYLIDEERYTQKLSELAKNDERLSKLDIENLDDLKFSKLSDADREYLFDKLAETEISNDKIAKYLFTAFSKDTHDKIPHSFIGSILKSGELSTLRDIVGQELTEHGFRGFRIADPVLKIKYAPKLEEVKTLIKILEKSAMESAEIMANKEGIPLSPEDADDDSVMDLLKNESILINYFNNLGFDNSENNKENDDEDED
jgi:hypothetical protein